MTTTTTRRLTVQERFDRMTQAEKTDVMQRMLTVKDHSDVMAIMGYTMIGYWVQKKDSPQTDNLRWPGDFIDESWGGEEREKVLAYIKRPISEASAAFGGSSWCRLWAETKPSYKERGSNTLEPWECNGSCEFCDGIYVWPQGYAHYIEEHKLKPPQEFIDHILSGGSVDRRQEDGKRKRRKRDR